MLKTRIKWFTLWFALIAVIGLSVIAVFKDPLDQRDLVFSLSVAAISGLLMSMIGPQAFQTFSTLSKGYRKAEAIRKSNIAGEKPKIDDSEFRKISFISLAGFNWILNPTGLIIELFFGIRTPRVGYVEKVTKKGKITRTFVPCPHCRTKHDGLTWSTQNGTGMKNWFGLYCPSCGKVIPCVMNIFSMLTLLVTSPVWIWFYKPLRRKWLESQEKRFTNLTYIDITA